MGPLAGLKVLEMAGLGPCPLAGQLLADMGAHVTVIDRRSGDNIGDEVNRRGKHSIALDLKHRGGIEIALQLAGQSDILIEGFRPGVMERLGLGPEPCRERNPMLVYGRMTGWGQEGPLSATAGHDITYLAVTGALHATGEAGRPPFPPLNLVADYGGGAMFLITGVLAAVIEARQSGEGQVVDAAMVDGVPAMMGLIHTMLARGIWNPDRQSNLLDGGAPFYRCYETSDGGYVAVGALEDQFFSELVDKTGIDPSWKKRRMNPGEWPELRGEFEAVFATRTRDAWAELFLDGDACVAPVLDWDEAARFGHNVSRGAFHEAGGVRQAAPAPRFSRNQVSAPEMARKTGAEGRDILAGLGYAEAEIRDLEQSGVIR